MVIMRRVARNMAVRRAEWLSIMGHGTTKSGRTAIPSPLKIRPMMSATRRLEIKRLKSILVIRRKVFWRLCNAVLFDLGFEKLRVSAEAAELIQELVEGFGVIYFLCLEQCAQDAGRVTVRLSDVKLFKSRTQNPPSKTL
ncbi:hypothetical protein J3F83DRAFT_733652 [Trichoderma novae-zelandiae]